MHVENILEFTDTTCPIYRQEQNVTKNLLISTLFLNLNVQRKLYKLQTTLLSFADQKKYLKMRLNF